MKLFLGISLTLIASTALACPYSDKGKEITFLPLELQSPVVTPDEVDPKLLTQADKQKKEQQKSN